MILAFPRKTTRTHKRNQIGNNIVATANYLYNDITNISFSRHHITSYYIM